MKVTTIEVPAYHVELTQEEAEALEAVLGWVEVDVEEEGEPLWTVVESLFQVLPTGDGDYEVTNVEDGGFNIKRKGQ